MTNYVDKEYLIHDLNNYLRDKITASDLDQVYAALHTILPTYEVRKCVTTDDVTAANNDYVRRFLDAKLAGGRSRNTTNRYWYILNRFFNSENISTAEVTASHIRDYFAKESERGISDGTLNGVRDVFNSYFGWLFNEGIIPRNPCANVDTMKVEQKVREKFTDVDIQKILLACNNPRDYAIVQFLLNTGCRVSEMCGLCMKDLYLEGKECRVRGKGKKNRKVYFNDVTAWALEKYLTKNPARSNEPVFRSKTGGAMTTNAVRQMLKRIEAKTDVVNVHPHRFRRTFATNAVNQQMPLQEVKAVLGHVRLDTTMKYVEQNDERTKRAYEYYIG